VNSPIAPRAGQPAGARRAVRGADAPSVTGVPAADRFLHVSPATAVIVFVPVAVAGAVLSAGRGSAATLAAWSVAGYFWWTLCEYWGHRIVLHYQPERGPGAKFHYIVHGVHHDYPRDARRSILSPVLSVPMVAAAFSVSALLRVPPVFGTGYAAGYLAYDLLHLYLHHGKPKNRLLRTMREYHMRHHFRDDTRGFGTSAPYCDKVFSTSIARPPRPGRARTRQPVSGRAGRA
jgi:dihydroceramide fatty acyl 2-hydroxylase